MLPKVGLLEDRIHVVAHAAMFSPAAMGDRRSAIFADREAIPSSERDHPLNNPSSLPISTTKLQYRLAAV